MRTKTIIILAGILIILVVAAIILVPRLTSKPQQVFTPPYWPTGGWQTSTPEERGLDSEKLTKVLQVIKDQDIQINSLMIIRNGYLLLNANFYNPYDGTYPHDMASVTKSVMSTLIGIAVGQGKINLDQKVISFFPELTIANMDRRKESLTVRHLVGMVNGFESGCLADDLGTIDRMRQGSSDWVQNTLDRKMVQDPGKSFCYDSPGYHLLSAILQKATGQTALDFARQYLFAPLGIKQAIWDTDLQGRNYGGGDLHLLPQDAAKIGYLILNNGVWDGVQVVPADWVKQATSHLVNTGDDDYGYGWWISKNSIGANGRGGQHIYIVPSLNAIVVSTGGGFEYDVLDPYISASVIDPSKPLPPNPDGVSHLQAAIDSFVKPLPQLPFSSQPATVQAISGKTYSIEKNSFGIEAMKIDFSAPDQAAIYLERMNADAILYIGLDGKYRQATEGSMLRGYWKDAQTFIVERFDVGLSNIEFDILGDAIKVNLMGQMLSGTMVNQ